ncbi:MAG: hypothetical protein ACFFB5_24895 [Promethearchaeota archaeon]
MTVDRVSMKRWVVEALKDLGGKGTILDICKKVWEKHGDEISVSGDIFYKWQYEIRWSGDILRKEGVLRPVNQSAYGVWELE